MTFRYLKTLKAYVKNYARLEACMAEGYLAGECMPFCMEFLKESLPVEESLPIEEPINCNEDIDVNPLILEGRPLQRV